MSHISASVVRTITLLNDELRELLGLEDGERVSQVRLGPDPDSGQEALIVTTEKPVQN